MICVPVMAATRAEALRIIGRSAGLADVLELRMDLLPTQSKVRELIKAVRSAGPAQVLVTNRPSGDLSELMEKERLGVLAEAIYLGADYVDVELSTATSGLEELRALIGAAGNRTRLIISHHDFAKTPAGRILRGLFHDCVRAGAGIVKIVTRARRPEDNLKVLELIPYALRRNVPIIALCMGEEGRMSRIMAPLVGGLFTFAALERGSESAAGQLTVEEMKRIWGLMEGKGHGGL